MKVHLSEEALLDVDQIATYTLETFGAAQRDIYINRLLDEVDDLGAYMKVARPVPGLPAVRGWPFQSHVIYFVETNDELIVVRILHQRQVPARHMPTNEGA